MSFADEVRTSLGQRPQRQNIAGHNFPSIGVQTEERLAYLEEAVAVIGRTLILIGEKVNEVEGRLMLSGG
jgi:hypothetical protein